MDNLEQAFQPVEEGGVLGEGEEPHVHRLMETVIDEQGNSQSSSKLQLISRGTCICVAWSDQKVDIKTAPLSVSDGDDGDVQEAQDKSNYLIRV